MQERRYSNMIVSSFIILICTCSVSATVLENRPEPKITFERFSARQVSWTDTSTNLHYAHVSDYGDYRLYKLIPLSGTTQAQVNVINLALEQYLQESFSTPERFYPNVLQVCGTTMLAFVLRNTTLAMKNINALLLARLEAYDNAEYVCFLSTVPAHRQKGLGTRLLHELINEAINARRSRVSLHVNTENTSAMALYLKCGLRCVEYISGYYFGDGTFPTQNAYAMSLRMQNIRNSTAVCQSATAVNISQQEETLYRQKCPQGSNG